MNEEYTTDSGLEEGVDSLPETEESEEPEATPSPSPVPELEEISERVERIDSTLAHPLLSTPLEDYTVCEGLLLGLLITIIVVSVVKLVKEALSWL